MQDVGDLMKQRLLLSFFLYVFVFHVPSGGFITGARAQEEKPLYLDPERPVEERVEDLVSRMTLEEKTHQMDNGASAIERLNIPRYNWWSECLHGVACAGIATVFPQAIGLGATWDPDLVFRVADVTSDEARAKHHDAVRKGRHAQYQGLTFWSPNINIFRDPRWGRGQETYGEDPYLTARLGVAFVQGLQGDDPKYLKLVSTPKHYAVHSGPEPLRYQFNAITNERDLRMTYLPAFKACVEEGGAQSIMCAYNRYRSEPCCGNKYLIEDILRSEWGFDGYVVSDCGAITNIHKDHKVVNTQPEAVAMAIKSGCDLSCGDEYSSSIVRAVETGLLTEEDVDKALKRLFKARFLLGMFDPPAMVPYAQISYDIVDRPEHRALALNAARASLVLLKNEKHILPLKKDKIKTIAVIGPNADDSRVLLGNYNGTPSRAVTPLLGIKNKLGSRVKVLYARGCEITAVTGFESIPSEFHTPPEAKPGQHGLKGEYFNNMTLEGEPVLTRIDDMLNFDWGGGAPAADVNSDCFSARWTGFLIPMVTGKYKIGITCDDGMRLSIDDQLILEDWGNHAARTTHKEIDLEAGHSYKLKIEFYENSLEALAKLVWAPPDVDPIKDAVEMALDADVVIAVMGISGAIEGESYDKKELDLPQVQEDLLHLLYKTGKPVILVLLGGSPISVNFADENIPAIIEAWYPGEEGGTAIADVLFGDYNPAGRLPVTFYKSLSQVPDFQDYDMEGRTYRYLKEEPLYPFGYGLSYTTFRYSSLKIEPEKPKPGEELKISVCVKNAGKIAGDEVAQLYISDLAASAPVPIRQLAGFQRIHLAPKEKRIVTFQVEPHQLAFWHDSGKWVVEPGEFELSVGGCQPLRKYAKRSGSKALTKRFNLMGKNLFLSD